MKRCGSEHDMLPCGIIACTSHAHASRPRLRLLELLDGREHAALHEAVEPLGDAPHRRQVRPQRGGVRAHERADEISEFS